MIVELGSFTKAAEMVHLSQPTLTEHIKSLEDYFECKLLDRRDRTITATQAGVLLYKYTKKIMLLKKEIEENLKRYKGRMEGTLELGASTIPGEYILPSLLKDFRDDYPGIIVNLNISDTKEIISNLLDDKIEIGIVGAKIENAKLSYHKFLEDELVLISPLSLSWYDIESIEPEELIDIPFIAREKGSGTWIMIEKKLKYFGIDVSNFSIVAVMGSTLSVIQGVRNGVGLSIVSRRAANSMSNNNDFKIIEIKGIDMKRDFFIVTRNGKALSPISETFLDFLSVNCDR